MSSSSVVRQAGCRARPARAITWASWNVRRTVSMIRPMPCESRVDDRDRAELVERALGGHRRRVDPLADELDVLGDRRTTRRG